MLLIICPWTDSWFNALLMMCLMSQTVFETVARVEPKKNESKITKIIHLIDFKIKLMWRGKVC